MRIIEVYFGGSTLHEPLDLFGEEEGREEASEDCENGVLASDLSYRDLYRYGQVRARSQGLAGRNAKLFAQKWAMGYQANCELFERERVSDAIDSPNAS